MEAQPPPPAERGGAHDVYIPREEGRGGLISTEHYVELAIRGLKVYEKRGLKRETESLIVAAQNQSIRTNLVKARIDKSQGDSLSRVCRKVDESIDHIVSGCCKLA